MPRRRSKKLRRQRGGNKWACTCVDAEGTASARSRPSLNRAVSAPSITPSAPPARAALPLRYQPPVPSTLLRQVLDEQQEKTQEQKEKTQEEKPKSGGTRKNHRKKTRKMRKKRRHR